MKYGQKLEDVRLRNKIEPDLRGLEDPSEPFMVFLGSVSGILAIVLFVYDQLYN